VTRSVLSRILSGPVVLAALIGATACGASEPAPAAAPDPAPTAAPDAHGGHEGGHGGGHGGHGSADGPAPALFAVQTGPLGIVLTDGSGHLVYRSDADRADPPTSNCLDACAQTWIPVTAPPDQELELAGVKKDLVGRLQRPDGSSQLTLAGWPLYRNRDDDGLLATAGRNGADGTWFVVTPKGEKATPA
jgi:predicted lipoprotein with Yx(FWY)xxD motif